MRIEKEIDEKINFYENVVRNSSSVSEIAIAKMMIRELNWVIEK